MKKVFKEAPLLYIWTILLFLNSCSSTKNLFYLYDLPEEGGVESFSIEIPDYKIQQGDILYITLKAMTPDGTINDFLTNARSNTGVGIQQGESGGYLYGYDVNSEGNVVLPVIGNIGVRGLTLEETRKLIQDSADKVFKDATAECKLLSFKFTVIGEVKVPGTYINYNNYLTIFEAVGRAGGVNDFGRRDKILIIRPISGGIKTYSLNLQDKDILSSEAYFLLPNDVIIVEPLKHKIFNMNLPTFSFILTTITSAITTTLLLINYVGK